MLLFLALACNNGTPTTTSMGPAPIPVGAPLSAQSADGVVARWDGGEIKYSELTKEIDTQLKQLEIEYLQNRYRVEAQALEERAMTQIIEAEAAKRGLDLEGLLRVEVEDKVATPTEDEAKEFYNVVKRQLRNAPYDEVKEQVALGLLNRRQGERMSVYLDELRVSYKLETQLAFPDLPRIQVSSDDDPVRGSADAEITIVEFADYQCGYCRKVFPTLQTLLTKYDGKVKLVYRDYPLGGPGGNMAPMLAANCAGDQGKYWEVHDSLMNDGQFSEPALKAAAQAAGVDIAQWDSCMADTAKGAAEIMKDFEDGQAAGVSGTPAFFINGVFLNGAVPIEQFEEVIERELAG